MVSQALSLKLLKYQLGGYVSAFVTVSWVNPGIEDEMIIFAWLGPGRLHGGGDASIGFSQMRRGLLIFDMSSTTVLGEELSWCCCQRHNSEPDSCSMDPKVCDNYYFFLTLSLVVSK